MNTTEVVADFLFRLGTVFMWMFLACIFLTAALYGIAFVYFILHLFWQWIRQRRDDAARV